MHCVSNGLPSQDELARKYSPTYPADCEAFISNPSTTVNAFKRAKLCIIIVFARSKINCYPTSFPPFYKSNRAAKYRRIHAILFYTGIIGNEDRKSTRLNSSHVALS